MSAETIRPLSIPQGFVETSTPERAATGASTSVDVTRPAVPRPNNESSPRDLDLAGVPARTPQTYGESSGNTLAPKELAGRTLATSADMIKGRLPGGKPGDSASVQELEQLIRTGETQTVEYDDTIAKLARAGRFTGDLLDIVEQRDCLATVARALNLMGPSAWALIPDRLASPSGRGLWPEIDDRCVGEPSPGAWRYIVNLVLGGSYSEPLLSQLTVAPMELRAQVADHLLAVWDSVDQYSRPMAVGLLASVARREPQDSARLRQIMTLLRESSTSEGGEAGAARKALRRLLSE